MLPEEQVENIKKQLISQLESSNLPNKEEVKSNIQAMNPEQLEQFLIQNKLIKQDDDSQETPQAQQCVFCSIISGNISSHKIDEDKDAIAVLEINPVSKAHTIIIPKQHIESGDKLPKTIFSLANKIAKKIKTKFKPKDVTIQNSNMFGHEIVNIIPVYKDETINSERKPAKQEDLMKIQKKLEKKHKPEIVKKPKIKTIKESDAKKLWLPRRVP